MLDDDDCRHPTSDHSYESVNLKGCKVIEAPFEGLGEKYKKQFYEEVTYGETREKEGRLEEKLQNENEVMK